MKYVVLAWTAVMISILVSASFFLFYFDCKFMGVICTVLALIGALCFATITQE